MERKVASPTKRPRTADTAGGMATYMGHGTIAITYDRYGHLMPGSEVEVRALLDAYLDGRPDA